MLSGNGLLYDVVATRDADDLRLARQFEHGHRAERDLRAPERGLGSRRDQRQQSARRHHGLEPTRTEGRPSGRDTNFDDSLDSTQSVRLYTLARTSCIIGAWGGRRLGGDRCLWRSPSPPLSRRATSPGGSAPPGGGVAGRRHHGEALTGRRVTNAADPFALRQCGVAMPNAGLAPGHGAVPAWQVRGRAGQ